MNTQLLATICILSAIILVGTTILVYRKLKKRAYYKETLAILEKLDRKYLLPEMLPNPSFNDAKILSQILYETNKSMNENVQDAHQNLTDFRDYIELWVHEVKTPLAALALHAPDRGTKIYLKSIENYIDQALYYSKIDTADKDYIIKKVDLGTAVNDVIKNNKDALIEGKIKVEISNLDTQVYSDPKWLQFIINQIISNAIKYRKNNPKITISAEKSKEATTLRVRDNGIGIKPSEQKRIFDKGFTGTNDRNRKSSTGMGLYVAGKLATDLGYELTVSSELGKYTQISITFGGNDFYNT